MKITTCIQLLSVIGLALTTQATVTAQIANPYSYFSSMNKSLWDAQNRLNDTIKAGEALVAKQNAPAAYSPNVPTAPVARYAITATDFQSMPWRQLPAQMASNLAGATLRQKSAARLFYDQLLTSYEQSHRRKNLAWAVTYAVATSLEITRGQAVSPAQADYLAAYVNDALANDPQFQSMSTLQKQALYESCILSGGIAGALHLQGSADHNPTMKRQADELARIILRQWAGM